MDEYLRKHSFHPPFFAPLTNPHALINNPPPPPPSSNRQTDAAPLHLAQPIPPRLAIRAGVKVTPRTLDDTLREAHITQVAEALQPLEQARGVLALRLQDTGGAERERGEQ